MILGEKLRKEIEIVNEGCLPTEVVIKSVGGLDIQTKTEASSSVNGATNQKLDLELEEALEQFQLKKVHLLKSYDNLKIHVDYIPKQIGVINLPLMLYFENYLHSPPI